MIKQTLAAALLAVSLLPGAAAARSQGEFRSQTVRYADLDLSERADAAALMSRIERAAGRVCRSGNRDLPQVRRQAQACRIAAIQAAVDAVNVPQLAALRDGDQLRAMAAL